MSPKMSTFIIERKSTRWRVIKVDVPPSFFCLEPSLSCCVGCWTMLGKEVAQQWALDFSKLFLSARKWKEYSICQSDLLSGLGPPSILLRILESFSYSCICPRSPVGSISRSSPRFQGLSLFLYLTDEISSKLHFCAVHTSIKFRWAPS